MAGSTAKLKPADVVGAEANGSKEEQEEEKVPYMKVGRVAVAAAAAASQAGIPPALRRRRGWDAWGGARG